ncbi:hypothetical protein BJV77DRAFT_1058148 [Russula vinacea]|nr:hypothetical protein BJV77DRAFT_1058148 [Russula vinacea]
MPTSSRLTPSWRGYTRIKKFMVFGDSYSHVGYSAQAPAPTSSNPLGVVFPGQPTNEPGLPNWIGYLIRDHGHGHANMVAYDYARRGDTVTGVYTNQVSGEFLPTVGRNPAWAAWGPTDSIFVTWVGANDCRILYTNDKAEITPIIATLFAAQIPFIGLVPVIFFSLTHVVLGLGHVLPNPIRPVGHGFNPADRTVQGGSIWFDFMHPTSRVHNILAGEIAQFLFSQPPQA